MKEVTPPWYKDGLCFSCTQCGKCCTGPSGSVAISEKEIEDMASFLKLEIKTFKRLYVKRRGQQHFLVEKRSSKTSSNYDCVFFKENKCTVYAARPQQCKTFPFWPENLNSEESWNLAAKDCEGIKPNSPREGKLYLFQEIQNITST